MNVLGVLNFLNPFLRGKERKGLTLSFPGSPIPRGITDNGLLVFDGIFHKVLHLNNIHLRYLSLPLKPLYSFEGKNSLGTGHYLCRGGRGWEKNVGHVKFSLWPSH